MVISKCLGFGYCRYDGQIVHCNILDKILPFIEVLTVCPECEIGLGVPRSPIRVVDGKTMRLTQPSTGRDLTERMQLFVKDFLFRLPEVDGFILKSKSPSCGFGTVKVFASSDAQEPLHKHGSGFLAKEVTDRLANLPYIDETALMDPESREHFLTKLFMLADLRLHTSSIKELMDFQARNKLLLMAYDQRKVKVLGRILADHKNQPFAENVAVYMNILQDLVKEKPSRSNTTNAFMHAFGYFSKDLGSDKKYYLLNCMEAYRKGAMTMQELRKAMIPRIFEFRVDYLADQTLFYPYPENLSFLGQE